MRKVVCGIIWLSTLISTDCFAQPQKEDYSQDYLREFLKSAYLDTAEYLSKIMHYDLSKLWTHENYSNAIVGFIGKNYQRLQIHFSMIIKNQEVPSQYFVYGKSKVKENICEFLGTINLLHARRLKESEYDTVTQGTLVAEYRFFESRNQRHTGVFKGIMKSHWYINRKGDIKYDDLSIEADGFSNNEFVGVWRSYATQESKMCNWAEFRVPYSDDLDIGAGEFSPNPQYLKYGWENYESVWGDYEKELKKDEWWK